jgi:purine-nucleoside/S-methyl-5'-thioadenosine phosphorylase / adenosine deaminase
MSRAFSLAYGQDDLFSSIPLGSASFGLRAGLSLAKAGDMSLARRAEVPGRDSFLQSIGAVPRRTFALHQVHSMTVLIVDGQEPQALEGFPADGMVSARRDLLLTVTVADCVPVFLVDPAHGAYGIAHSGWKGTGIVREALLLMSRSFGTKPAEVTVVLGPGIGPCCYRVTQERYEKFRADFGGRAVVRGEEPGDYRLDMGRANVDLLTDAEVRDVRVCTDCTRCSSDLGSFRRQGAESFTRMLAFIGYLPGAPI